MRVGRLASRIWVFGLALAVWAGPAVADERTDFEASLFSEEAVGTTLTAQAPALTLAALPAPEPSVVGFSGQITSALIDQIGTTRSADVLSTLTLASLFLDVRLPQQAKMFANIEATYYSQGQSTSIFLREMFLDFNLNRAVYFRTGKQVLQWGRCLLWNPTDIINVERQHFIRILGNREGAYGLKAHLPFGTWLNFYDFLDTGTATEAGSAANAFKVEFLLGELEAAFSAWVKKGFRPIWGFDFSTRVLGLDLVGELGASQEDTQTRALVQDEQLVAGQRASWTGKASMNVSRSFTVGHFKDQLTVMLEGYYDSAGYDRAMLADTRIFPFAVPAFSAGSGTMVRSGTLREFIQLNNLYQPNYLSKTYSALFITFTRFLLTDLTLNANYIHNWIDASGLVSCGLTYRELNTFTAGLLINTAVGYPDKEYTVFGNKFDLQLTFGISF